MEFMVEIFAATVSTLVFGGFAYTFSLERRMEKKLENLPSKKDVEHLEERIDMLYEHLLNRPMPLPKNGDRK